MIDPYDVPDDDLKALQEEGAPDGFCPACGEIDCDFTCYACLEPDYAPEPDWDGDPCAHCGSTCTLRIDTICNDPAIWVCQCAGCGETFEVVIP